MRAVASAAMAVLLVAALLAGNCLSCPQLLLTMASHHQSHGCCHPGGKHTQTATCHTQALSHFVKADGAQIAPAVTVPAAVLPALLPAAAIERSAIPALADHAPPTQLPIRI